MLIHSSTTPLNCLKVGNPPYHIAYMRHAKFEPVPWRGGCGGGVGKGGGDSNFQGLNVCPPHETHSSSSLNCLKPCT